MKIGLLFSDMSFSPSGRHISDTCWRHSHLHESYTYYIVPTCRRPRETSSWVGGSNSKLLLPVTWHRVAVIIYVHRTVVFRPRGHLVHLWQFQLYDARRAETLLKPSDANSTMCQESLLPMEDSRRLNRVRGNMGGLPSDGFSRNRKREGRGHPEGIGLCFGFSSVPLRLHQVREEGRLWHDLQRSEHVRTCWGFGVEQIPESEKCYDWASCKLVPTGLGLCGTLTDTDLQDNRKAEKGRGWGMRWVLRGLRGQPISQGVLLNKLNTGKLSGSASYLTSIAEGWKVGKKKEKQRGKGRVTEECGNKDVWWVGYGWNKRGQSEEIDGALSEKNLVRESSDATRQLGYTGVMAEASEERKVNVRANKCPWVCCKMWRMSCNHIRHSSAHCLNTRLGSLCVMIIMCNISCNQRWTNPFSPFCKSL